MSIEIEDDTIAYMIKKYDKDGKGELNYEAFETILNSS